MSGAVMWCAGGSGFGSFGRTEGNLRLFGKTPFNEYGMLGVLGLTHGFYENRSPSHISNSQFQTSVLCHKLFLATD